jgi:hypothetical protein
MNRADRHDLCTTRSIQARPSTKRNNDYVTAVTETVKTLQTARLSSN